MAPQNSNSERLHPGFVPNHNTVICGRARAGSRSSGNQRLRQIVAKYAKSYSFAKKKKEKISIVSTIIEETKNKSETGEEKTEGYFVLKKHDGYWYEVEDNKVRDKIGGLLRECLHTKYRSSSQSKRIIAKTKELLLLHEEMPPSHMVRPIEFLDHRPSPWFLNANRASHYHKYYTCLNQNNLSPTSEQGINTLATNSGGPPIFAQHRATTIGNHDNMISPGSGMPHSTTLSPTVGNIMTDKEDTSDQLTLANVTSSPSKEETFVETLLSTCLNENIVTPLGSFTGNPSMSTNNRGGNTWSTKPIDTTLSLWCRGQENKATDDWTPSELCERDGEGFTPSLVSNVPTTNTQRTSTCADSQSVSVQYKPSNEPKNQSQDHPPQAVLLYPVPLSKFKWTQDHNTGEANLDIDLLRCEQDESYGVGYVSDSDFSDCSGAFSADIFDL